MPAMIVIAFMLLLPRVAIAEPNRNSLINTVDCERVRLLTAVERQYWIWRFSLTAAEVRVIKRRCGIT